MRKIGIRAVYRAPRTTILAQGHRIYPYLLSGRNSDRPNKVWAAGITFIPMARGLVYPVVILDWHWRRGLSWRVSNTLPPDLCVEALEDALARHGAPDIFNSDQGSPFTSEDFTSVLEAASVEYEEVYLRAYDSVTTARASLGRYFSFSNSRGTHQTLAGRTPDEVHFKHGGLLEAARYPTPDGYHLSSPQCCPVIPDHCSVLFKKWKKS